MKVIDLTHTITENMPVYPGTERPTLIPSNSYEKDGFKETKIGMYSHTGTHIDPPAHIFEGRKTLDAFSADFFVGKAVVIDCTKKLDGSLVSMADLEVYNDRLDSVDFLLFNFGWDKKWGEDGYFGDYPCLDDSVVDFVIKKNYKGIGFDVIGLDPISDAELKRHKKLFSSKDMINVENLKNLHLCGEGIFTFCCLPLKIKNSDGAPARAIAIID